MHDVIYALEDALCIAPLTSVVDCVVCMREYSKVYIGGMGGVRFPPSIALACVFAERDRWI